MDITGIIISTSIVAGAGILIGVLLGIASKVFHVEVDEKEIQVRELLPGNNCGGCGYAGCDQLAKAIVTGEALASACPVGGTQAAKSIAEIVGGDAEVVRKTAFVKCGGTADKTTRKYDYSGNKSCIEAAFVPGSGEKSCKYGCMGYGSCVDVCEFNAIHVKNGIAVVDREECVACGKCVKACPKNLIEIIPYDNKYIVACISQYPGKQVKTICQTGCIACKICEKACQFDAIHVENNIAKIDYEKCTNCGECAKKCPSKIIFFD